MRAPEDMRFGGAGEGEGEGEGVVGRAAVEEAEGWAVLGRSWGWGLRRSVGMGWGDLRSGDGVGGVGADGRAPGEYGWRGFGG